ncbi:MAG: GH92 family glycosyl hydrolase [Tannerella sp.]|jgi:predicted alpha-1,2-mannosidase|nr:GH92 family glycosyl hydrolase [Tannerella sp.]
MKYIYLFFLLFAGTASAVFSRNKILFETGKYDGSASEFALSPDRYDAFLATFGGEKSYYVGYSSPDKHWPYALPGPLDRWGGGGYWAGYHPRHFPSVWFRVEKTVKQGDCVLSLFFAGVNDAHPVRIRIEVNGHRFEEEIKGEDKPALLTGKQATGVPQTVTVRFPVSWIREGINRIQLGSVAGSWALFDCIRLETPEKVLLGKASSSLVRSAVAAPFEYAREDGSQVQPVLVDMMQFDASRELTFQVSGFPAVTRMVEAGESIQEIYMPALPAGKGPQKTGFTIRSGNEMIYRCDIVRSPSPLHEYADDVDLLMGTGNSRWMFKPSPCLPFSMVQIAPDNQDEIWKAGYEYTVENIMGFSHFCDYSMAGLLMQPTCGALQVNPGREQYPDEGYRSRIDKLTEQANTGHYSVYMTDTKIKAELTATRHAALQRYTFPKRNDARILIDLFFPAEIIYNLTDARITKVSNSEIEGYASCYSAFSGYTMEQNYTLYFVLQFSKPFRSMGGWVNEGVEPLPKYISTWNRNHEFTTPYDIRHDITEINGKGDVGVFVEYHTGEREEILVRSGVSLVDMEGARNNLAKELSEPFGWDFEKIVQNARNIWNEYLGRIHIETDDYLQKKKFYTNLYRAIAAKAVWSDADGRYRDEDETVRQLPKPSDAIVSGEYWNTFWNIQPLFNLIAPEMSSVWARSAIELYRNTGWFNTDPCGIEHTGVMVAMHVISQIQSAWQSGIRDFDLPFAYEGLKKMLTVPPQKYSGGGTAGVEHLPPYQKHGYVPAGKGYVSNTLEYAYDDWTLAQMALTLGKNEDADSFMLRSENWRNIFDTVSGFMRPKDETSVWVKPFDPYHTPGFVEGNAFNYTWFVPQNPRGLIEAMGKERFVARLDEAMEKSSRANFNAAGDDFANYPINHGNETSMEVAALFNWADAPRLTQKWVRAIQEQYYGVTPYDAYPGDEDLGQMSGWFVMSALGLFQLDGGCSQEPAYELTSPRYPKAVIRLDGKYGRGQTFVIEAKNASKENKYIQKVELNGQLVDGFWIPQSEVLKGGHLMIEMGSSFRIENEK